MITLYKEFSFGVKNLSDADLGWSSSSSSQTHIGLSEKVLTFLPNTPVQKDGILIYNRSCSIVECAFSKISDKRSPKIDSITTNPVKSVVKQIRNIAANQSLQWFLIWFALDNEVPVFWLLSNESEDYNGLSDLFIDTKGAKCYNASKDEYYTILSHLRTITKLEALVSKKYSNSKNNVLIASSKEHRTFVHLCIDYFRATNSLDKMLPYFSTEEMDSPVTVVSKEEGFKLANMFIFSTIENISERNSTSKGRRWYIDPSVVNGRNLYLYVDWYPGKDKDGKDVQLMIPDFAKLVNACYGRQFQYRNTDGIHEMWLVKSASNIAKTIDLSNDRRIWLWNDGKQAEVNSFDRESFSMGSSCKELGDWNDYNNYDEFKATYNQKTANQDGSIPNAYWNFKQVSVNDYIVVFKCRKNVDGKMVHHIYGFGKFTSELIYNDVEECPYSRNVEWVMQFPHYVLNNEMKSSIFFQGTTDEEAEHIAELINKAIDDNFEDTEVVEVETERAQVPFSISSITTSILSTNLIYSDLLIKRFTYALLTKPFVILSGLAGSGKTQLALAFAKAMVEDEGKQMCVVPVGADWTNREPLLGFPNALQSEQYVRPENGVLDLLIECNKPENADKPYFLILDEMNLSYVERYFADFLSAMESHEDIPLWKGKDQDGTPNSIGLPKNLFIIGTINVDETTYMFSPKVLDRANVIEFKVSSDDMESFLDAAPQVEMKECEGKAAEMAADFVKKAKKSVALSTKANETLKAFFKELKSVNAEFGYRSATEIGRYISLADGDLTDDEAIDSAIVQKLLPKLHGSRKKILKVLEALWKLCGCEEISSIESKDRLDAANTAKYPLTADKILRMYNSAIDNGFTSFAEA